MRLAPRPPTAPPEDSVAIRVVVALAVEVGIVAVVLQGAVDAATAVAALVLAPIGYLVSHRRRHRNNVGVKVALALGLLVALARFLSTMGGITTVDQAREPLAGLFLWVQVLHAFDVPRRRDLAFSMVSSVTLVAVGGALSLTTSYLFVLVPWAVLAAAWLWLSARPRPDQVAHPISTRRIAEGRTPRAAGLRSGTAAGVVAVLVGALVFLSMPRLPATLVRTPPFQLGDQGRTETDGDEIRNPGLPSAGTDGVVDFAPDGYPGFSSAMDLRSRGQLSDEIAFRVRADQPALWRAEVFDTFDGVVWTASASELRPVPRALDDDGYLVPPSDLEAELPSAFSRRVVQTFYLDSVQPNVLFGAARIERAYFPSSGLRIDRHGSITSPILLDEGLVYSVVSEVPAVPFQILRTLPSPDPGARPLARYLQLPEDQPARVGALARELTAGTSSEADAVVAVQSWLRTNTVYDLGVAREPEGADAVDHFLFETRRGFCEHIASAMVVLLRHAGIPARIAVGFGAGQRNPFTGYWEVRQSDAHAWVEVWYPDAGWISYDPTFGVPAADPSFASRFPITEAVAAIGGFLRAYTPQGVKATVGALAGGAMSGLRAIVGAWPVALAAAVLVASVGLALRRGRRRRRTRGPTDPAGRAYEELLAALTASGHVREPGETPREVLAAARASWPDERRDAAEVVVATFERTRWAPPGVRPDAAEAARAADAAATLRGGGVSRS